jgi:hypothetical protein
MVGFNIRGEKPFVAEITESDAEARIPTPEAMPMLENVRMFWHANLIQNNFFFKSTDN